jgi:hypothetical protein
LRADRACSGDRQSDRFDRHQHDPVAERAAYKTVALMEADGRFVDRMRDHAPCPGDFGCREASPQGVDQERRPDASASPS